MAVNGKQKGNAFERKIANMLSERFQQHTGLEQSFRRNPDSGSFFGGSNQTRLESHGSENAQLGDIICPSDFKFCIECKSYKTAPGLHVLLSQECTQWDEWIEQALQDAKNTEKNFLLIIKYNRVKEFVITDDLHINPDIIYKGHAVMPLTEFLSFHDSFFFDNSVIRIINDLKD